MSSFLENGIWVVVGVVISIISFFLKRTIGRVDECEDNIDKHKENTVTKEVHEKAMDECKEEIKRIREDYTPKSTHNKAIDECREDIKQIKEDYIMKEDFYRELGKVDRKLDYITDILLKQGAKSHG